MEDYVKEVVHFLLDDDLFFVEEAEDGDVEAIPAESYRALCW